MQTGDCFLDGPATVIVARGVLVFVFLVAASAKFRHSLDPVVVRLFGISEAWTRPVSMLLVAIELGLAAGLAVAGRALIGAALLSSLLFLCFTVGLWHIARTGYEGGCGCFGRASEERVGVLEVVRGCVLAGLSGYVAYAATTEPCATLPIWSASGVWLSVAAGVSLMLVLLHFVLTAMRRTWRALSTPTG